MNREVSSKEFCRPPRPESIGLLCLKEVEQTELPCGHCSTLISRPFLGCEGFQVVQVSSEEELRTRGPCAACRASSFPPALGSLGTSRSATPFSASSPGTHVHPSKPNAGTPLQRRPGPSQRGLGLTPPPPPRRFSGVPRVPQRGAAAACSLSR